MPNHKWVMIKSGTVIKQQYWRNERKTHTLSEDETKLRYCVEKTYVSGGTYDWGVLYKGNTWLFENSKTAFTEIKIPSLKKQFTTLAVKGSEWEFERDWVFNGWVDDGTAEHTIPAGTRVKIVDQKMRLAWYHPKEKCIVAELNSGLEVFADRRYFAGLIKENAVVHIPAREASQYLKLVTAGKAKTYWKMEDSEGNVFINKRFANLGNLKSSLRVRFALVKDTNDDDDDDYLPEWVTYDDYDRPDTSNGIFAVQYDHATDKEIHREDMKEFLLEAVLKS